MFQKTIFDSKLNFIPLSVFDPCLIRVNPWLNDLNCYGLQ